MNKKAFTLIELLAVIIILALLMAIAIPMVSKYIEQSRKKAHITTSAAFVDGLAKEIVSNNLPLMMDSDTVYYIPFNCIPIEKGGTSPHGTWEFAYVLMTYDSGNRNYYIYSKDAKGMGIEGVKVEKIKASDVKHILGTKDDLIAIPGKTKSSIVQDTCDFGNQIVESGFTPDDSCFNISPGGSLTSNFPGSYEGVDYIPDMTHSCYTQELIIPITVNGIEVSSIGSSAFVSHGLTTLKIPSTVKFIGVNAFQDNQLGSVSIPNSVTSIGGSAFAGNQLGSVNIPDSVTSIEDLVFYNNRLTSVNIPDSVTSIGSLAFQSNQLSSVSIPNSVTSIGYSAFRDNQLSSVSIPNSVTSIGNYAFFHNQLSSVSIPNSVTSIGYSAFRDNQLSSVSIPNSVTSIGDYAFRDNQLSSVSIPNSVTSIEDLVFYNNRLTSVNIPDSVTSIGSSAFQYNQLTQVTIPSSVSSIGDYTFSNNPLGTITMQGRENTTDMTLEYYWNGSGTIVFAP